MVVCAVQGRAGELNRRRFAFSLGPQVAHKWNASEARHSQSFAFATRVPALSLELIQLSSPRLSSHDPPRMLSQHLYITIATIATCTTQHLPLPPRIPPASCARVVCVVSVPRCETSLSLSSSLSCTSPSLVSPSLSSMAVGKNKKLGKKRKGGARKASAAQHTHTHTVHCLLHNDLARLHVLSHSLRLSFLLRPSPTIAVSLHPAHVFLLASTSACLRAAACALRRPPPFPASPPPARR